MNRSDVRRLATCGVLLGASFVLSFIKIIKFPFGGSVTLFSMVPVIMAGILYGVKWGTFTSCGYAVLQLIQSIATSESFVLDAFWKTTLMILFDFIFAFAFLGLSGVFIKRDKRAKQRIALRGALGTLLVTLLRYVMHVVSGAILFGTYADWFFGNEAVNKLTHNLGTWAVSTLSGNPLAWFYSLIYNGFFMIPEIILSVVAVFVLLKIPQIKRWISF